MQHDGHRRAGSPKALSHQGLPHRGGGTRLHTQSDRRRRAVGGGVVDESASPCPPPAASLRGSEEGGREATWRRPRPSVLLRRRLLPPPLATLQAPEASKLFLFLFGVTSASRLGSPERPLLFKKEVRLGWRMSRIHLHSEWGLPYVT